METITLILPQAERILSLSISHEMSLMFMSPNDHLVVTARVGVTQAISSAPTRHKGGVGARAALKCRYHMHSHAISASPLTSSPVLAGFIK